MKEEVNEIEQVSEDIKKENSKKKFIKALKEWAICIGIALLIAILINKFLLYKVYIPSESMVPTLNEDDQLFVTRIYNYDKIERGDILVFYSEENDDTFIKRVIGLPGDTVKIVDGVVFVNDKELKEDYVKNNDTDENSEFKVPKGKYFFLGDNRAISNDSRRWKDPFVDEDDIQAKAVLKVYPFSDFGFID